MLPACCHPSRVDCVQEYPRVAAGEERDVISGTLLRDYKIISAVNCVRSPTLAAIERSAGAEPIAATDTVDPASDLILDARLQAVAAIVMCGLTWCLTSFSTRLYYASAGGRKWCASSCSTH